MDLSEKFGPIRKGLLEFAVLRVIAAEKLYVAEMLQRLAGTEFATQEGTLYPLLSRLRREEPGRLRMAGVRRRTAAQVLPAHRPGRRAWMNCTATGITCTTPSPAWETDMRKVTTINLNNNAYQIDEDGYEALRAYLDARRARWRTIRTATKSSSDLEQAIADKCRPAWVRTRPW